MNRPAKIMNIGNMIAWTEAAKHRVNSWIELANEVINDARKKERLIRYECKACFYSSRIGGQVITEQPCMCCGKNLMYASTNTDSLCIDCANEHSLCKHCGGDIEMRTRRKNWPNKHKKENL